jgi:two-component system, LuxR family, sensor kinase FixL
MVRSDGQCTDRGVFLVTETPLPLPDIEDRLRFETLISDLSARFVRIHPTEVDGEIERALRLLLDFFRCDRCALLGTSPDRSFVHVTHAAYGDGIEPVPKDMNLIPLYPWSYEKLFLRGEPLLFHSLSDLPSEAAVDREARSLLGVVSFINIPLFVEEAVRYSILIQFLHRERPWPDVVAPRLKLLGEIFANALERKRADEALRLSEERLSLAAESAGAGLWILDAQKRVFWVTPKTREIFGFAQDLEVTVEVFLGVVHDRDRGRILETIREAVEERKEVSIDYQILGPCGEARWVSSRGRPRVGSAGEVERVMGTSVDTTERRRAEAEAQVLRQELAHIARVNMMGEMAASLAHELAQPLTAIRSNAQAARLLLASDGIDLAELDEILEDIVADDQRAGEMIRRLRSMLKKGDFDVQVQDLNELIREVASLVRNDALLKEVTVVLDLQEGLPHVRVDRIQIQQVLLNLMVNALEAVAGKDGHGGTMEVRTFVGEAHEVRAAFRDSGPGIPEGQSERIFEPFVTTKADGMGMGLSICRTIIHAHGGRLWAEDHPGGGATFHLALPKAGNPP